MIDAAQLSLLAAFAAGVISFISPCIAPLVPGYLSLVSGVTLGVGPQGTIEGLGRRVALASVVFVAGFTLVFVTLGASASLLGGLLDENRRLLNRVAGIVMVLMGLFVLGALRIPWLYGEHRLELRRPRALSRSEVLLPGMAFGFGWTPCIGPLLASILIYTSAAQNVGRGVLLLLAYSLGLGLPFIIAGLGLGRISGALRWMTRHYNAVAAVSGASLMLVGVMLFTDRFYYFNRIAQQFYYQVVAPITG